MDLGLLWLEAKRFTTSDIHVYRVGHHEVSVRIEALWLIPSVACLRW